MDNFNKWITPLVISLVACSLFAFSVSFAAAGDGPRAVGSSGSGSQIGGKLGDGGNSVDIGDGMAADIPSCNPPAGTCTTGHQTCSEGQRCYATKYTCSGGFWVNANRCTHNACEGNTCKS